MGQNSSATMYSIRINSRATVQDKPLKRSILMSCASFRAVVRVSSVPDIVFFSADDEYLDQLQAFAIRQGMAQVCLRLGRSRLSLVRELSAIPCCSLVCSVHPVN